MDLTIDDRLRAEQAVLGSMLIDERCIPGLLAKVDAADFTLKENRLIFQTIRDLFRSNVPADAITVRDKLGGEFSKYLVDLMDITPTSANADAYARIMHEQAALERIKETCRTLLKVSSADETRPLIAQLTQSLDDSRNIDIWTMQRVLDYFQHSQTDDTGAHEYISVGIKTLDDGSYLQRGDVLVIAGEPSAGKTALGLTVAMHMAKTYKVGFFSLETRSEKLADRLITEKLDIDFNDIKRRSLKEADWTKFAKGGADLLSRKLELIPLSGASVTDIRNITTACGYEIIFIDYAQLLRPDLPDRVNKAAQMADVSQALHIFAQKSGVLLVEMLQLSRSEKGGWREPDQHDLKETGQWEQDADEIVMIYRPNPKDTEYDQESTRVIKIAKNKEGRRGSWYFAFDGSHQRFTQLVDRNGRALMRELQNRGKAAKEKMRRESISGQMDFREIRPDGTEPF